MTDGQTNGRTDRRTDGRMDRRTDGGDCNIPGAFLKSAGIIKRIVWSKRIIDSVCKVNLYSQGKRHKVSF